MAADTIGSGLLEFVTARSRGHPKNPFGALFIGPSAVIATKPSHRPHDMLADFF